MRHEGAGERPTTQAGVTWTDGETQSYYVLIPFESWEE